MRPFPSVASRAGSTSCTRLVGVSERALLRCSGGTNLLATHQHLFLQQETDCRGWRRCTEMFVCYIPDERASLCYAARGIVLAGQNSRLCSKSEAKKTQSMRGVGVQGFSMSVNFTKMICHNRIYVRELVEVFAFIVRAYPCLCLISQQNVCMCLGYPVRI